LFFPFNISLLDFPTPPAWQLGEACMEKVAIDELKLKDLQGRPVSLQDYFQEYSLVIFLRHLA